VRFKAQTRPAKGTDSYWLGSCRTTWNPADVLNPWGVPTWNAHYASSMVALLADNLRWLYFETHNALCTRRNCFA
jgi:hypothetical protein